MCLQPPRSCGRNGSQLQWTHFTWGQSTGRLAHLSTHISLPISSSPFLNSFLFQEKIKIYSKHWLFIRTFPVQSITGRLHIGCPCCWLKTTDSILLICQHSLSCFTLQMSIEKITDSLIKFIINQRVSSISKQRKQLENNLTQVMFVLQIKNKCLD